MIKKRAENHGRRHTQRCAARTKARTRRGTDSRPPGAVASLLLASMVALIAMPPSISSQGLPASAMLRPATETWATYNGDYSGRRFSTLAQINASNVRDLGLAWVFETGTQGIKSTPLEVDGILYFSVPDYVWAVDARTGRMIWEYHRPSQGDHIGQRGVGMYGEWLYFTTPDAHLVSLNAKDGSVRWIIQLADPNLGYFSTMAPLVVRNHVIVGVSGDVTDIPGFLESIDPASGKVQWRWYTEPAPGAPGSNTWPANSDAIRHGGGMTWMTGTYDPKLNLIYWGVGNPNPVLAGAPRPGDNLFTCSVVALNPDTGKLVWYFQASPHDVHDWDAVETPVLFNAPFGGKSRELLAQASRNGFFFLLDRTNGRHLVTAPFINETWASAIDARGEPIRKTQDDPRPDGALVEPSSDGATNWLAPSYDPQTGLFYVSARRTFSVFYLTAAGKAEGWAGTDRGLWSDSAIRAIDYRTGKCVWDHEIGRGEGSAGILTTAGHLLFTADTSGNLLALDPLTGKTLWHAGLGGRIGSSPETYELDGRQYLVVAAKDLLFAFKAPSGSEIGAAH